MKDLHWILVFGSILITPFLPALLRAKCPSCRKRKLQSLDTLRVPSVDEKSGFTFIALYKCDFCEELFKKEKDGAIEKSTQEEHQSFSEQAIA